ncbi:U1 zinc finger, partial [Musa troglodytarum]
YWVSQGNKWCDFCKIYIANNPLSIRTRELGQRHKDNVAKRLATMRKESAAWEKEQKEAARAVKEIEAKSYQNDLASFQRADTSDGLQSNKKITDEAQCSAATRNEDGAAPKPIVGRAPGLVISTPLNPMRAVKGAQSSVAVKRTKRVGEKAKVISEEEAEALKAREAAGKRMEEGEKPLTGLYKSHMKLATQEFCISPQSAVPQSKSRSYVWTMFETSTTWLLFHRFPQFLPADPTALSVPEGGRQRNPLSISSYRLQAEPPKHNPVTLQHHAQNRGGRRRGAPPFSIDLVSSIVPTTHLYQFALFGVGSFDMEITRLFDAFMWLDTAFSHVFDLCELHTKTYGSTIPL